jgi:D-alanyl-lipoteichoic acid acyltransferase DltB (MBOAT superfamily)
MLFNSPIFIYIFLPIAVFVYYLLNKNKLVTAGRVWLVAASFFFYGYWAIEYLILIVASILANYYVGKKLSQLNAGKGVSIIGAKGVLIIGIIANLSLLAYYKYYDFFVSNVNDVFELDLVLLHTALPLAISFFTFQQIAYLVDSYRNETHEYNFLNYCLFVTFFPQLIAGPIVHHREMMPQFNSYRSTILHYKNIATGLFVFCIGLFKKVVIADQFAKWANAGFDSSVELDAIDSWATSLSYTFQLYYDFSGYTDMAIGAALLFNIRLPFNFNSPYRAVNIQDFWRRWHITLSRWLRDYVYIPLGGSRNGDNRTYLNLFTTFLIGGLWHGANWTFIIWGALHGVALIAHRCWSNFGLRMPLIIGWLTTFVFINCTWVIFRSDTPRDAVKILKGMFGFNTAGSEVLINNELISLMRLEHGFLSILENKSLIVGAILVFLAAVFSVFGQNTNHLSAVKFNYKIYKVFFVATTLFYAYIVTNSAPAPEFLYFNF